MIDANVSSETLARAPGGGASSFPGGFPAGERRSRGGVACRAIAGDGFGSRSGDGDNVCVGDDVCVGDASPCPCPCPGRSSTTARRNGAGTAPTRGPLTGVAAGSAVRTGVFWVGLAAMNSRTLRWMTLAATSLTKDLKPPPMGEALAGAGASSGHTGRSGDAVSAAAAGVDGLALRSSSLARAMRSSVRLFSAITSRTFSSDSSLRDLSLIHI